MFPDELVVIGVHSAKFSSEKLTENIRNAVMRHAIQHPVVNDSGLKIWTDYAVRAWPTLVIVDPRGRIAGDISGEILADDLAVTIREIIAEQADLIDRSPWETRKETSLVPDYVLRYPSKVLASENGLLYIADSGHHRVIEAKLSENLRKAEVLRVFGQGVPGLLDGLAQVAQFNGPHGMALDATQTNLYVADTENHALRKIDLASGSVNMIAGTGEKAHGRYAITQPTQTPLRSPWALTLIDRYLFIAMAGSHQVWVLIDEQQLGPFAGSGAEALLDGPLNQCGFNQPSDIAAGFGYLFIADPEASAVRAIALSDEPKTSTLIGQGLFDFGDMDGSGENALLQHPTGLVLHNKTLYIADTYNHKIKAYQLDTGQVATLIGSGHSGMRDGAFAGAELYEPEGLTDYKNHLIVADTNNHQIRIADLAAGEIRTLELTHLERLAGMVKESPPETRAQPFLVRSGSVAIQVDFDLPSGTKINPDAPGRIMVQPGNRQFEIQFPRVTWEDSILANQDMLLDYALYYCDAADERVCRVKFDQFTIPLVVSAEGASDIEIQIAVKDNIDSS